MPERLKGADCKSADKNLHRFKSYSTQFLLENQKNLSPSSYSYFEETIKETKLLYNKNNLTKLFTKNIPKLEFAFKFLILDFYKSVTNSIKNPIASTGYAQGDIIDVTE